ncbi:hypothetical protein PR202_gb19846 [Eleusine coracana subsp. coracana]|uniref:JmjC domain-containing protein n=1 Tax=Eleusine coracana subsp. coracana TaxID=191504 RepID=A0AAV5F900_ELECO|nr:hypothetical protein PR202_gb19846 [Eleusine coracana subsp. coracana]
MDGDLQRSPPEKRSASSALRASLRRSSAAAAAGIPLPVASYADAADPPMMAVARPFYGRVAGEAVYVAEPVPVPEPPQRAPYDGLPLGDAAGARTAAELVGRSSTAWLPGGGAAGTQSCHQCRNDGDVVWCTSCDRRGYCASCIAKWYVVWQYSDIPVDDVQKVCPACRGICNCKVCLQGDNLIKVFNCCHRTSDIIIPYLLGPKTDILRAKMNSDEQMCWNDIPKLNEYLFAHWEELSASSQAVPSVKHAIYDQAVYLNSCHKKMLKDQYGIEPWTFHQHIGEAVFIPAGCPFQVKNLQSTVQLALDFLSPESLPESVRMAEEIRCLPNGHVAKLKMLEIKKISLYAASSAVREIQRLTLDPNKTDCTGILDEYGKQVDRGGVGDDRLLLLHRQRREERGGGRRRKDDAPRAAGRVAVAPQWQTLDLPRWLVWEEACRREAGLSILRRSAVQFDGGGVGVGVELGEGGASGHGGRHGGLSSSWELPIRDLEVSTSSDQSWWLAATWTSATRLFWRRASRPSVGANGDVDDIHIRGGHI